MKNYLQGVIAEVKKVKWPTRRQTYVYTVIVLIFSIVLAFFLGGLDFLFTYLLNTFFI